VPDVQTTKRADWPDFVWSEDKNIEDVNRSDDDDDDDDDEDGESTGFWRPPSTSVTATVA